MCPLFILWTPIRQSICVPTGGKQRSPYHMRSPTLIKRHLVDVSLIGALLTVCSKTKTVHAHVPIYFLAELLYCTTPYCASHRRVPVVPGTWYIGRIPGRFGSVLVWYCRIGTTNLRHQAWCKLAQLFFLRTGSMKYHHLPRV